MKYRNDLEQKLVTIGLTPQEAKMYLLVLRSPQLKVRDVATQLNILVPSAHRSLSALRNMGLIMTMGKRPLKLRAADPAFALPHLITTRYQKQLETQRLIEKEVKRQALSQEELGVQFLEGKSETYEYVLPIFQKLKNELLILSVGEPVPDEIFIAIVEAIRQGVEVKMLAEKYDESNRELLKNWEKNGYQVKHLPKPALGFTLTVHDGESCVVQIRREKEKEQRVGIAIHNPGYAQAQRLYFLSLWAKAKPLN